MTSDDGGGGFRDPATCPTFSRHPGRLAQGPTPRECGAVLEEILRPDDLRNEVHRMIEERGERGSACVGQVEGQQAAARRAEGVTVLPLERSIDALRAGELHG